MNEILSFETLQTAYETVKRLALERVLTLGTAIQVAAALVALTVGGLFGRRVRKYLEARIEGRLKAGTRLERLVQTAVHLIPVGMVILLVWMASLGIRQAEGETFLLGIVQTLLVAWLTIKLATSMILDRFWARLIAAAAWTLAALHIVGLLDPAIGFLDGLGFTMGKVHLTALSLIKAGVVLLVLLRVGTWLGDTVERKLRQVPALTPSTTVLLTKAFKISLFTILVLVALNSVGIDFTALAVFSGALGVGVGFGLQKVVGNFVSGVILLLDKSIKPGDVIEIGDVYGWITDLKGRYVSVVTRDGKELLIPNEDLITQQVINWSFTNRNIRIKVPIGISYHADPRKAMDLVVEAASGVKRVLDDPAPVCRLKGFGDNSVDLELRFWIDDPQNGTMNVQSAILLEIWDRFKEHDIEIPFPQRDVHLDLRSSEALERFRHGGGSSPSGCTP